MRTLLLGLLATSTMTLTACHTAATTGADVSSGAATGGDRLDPHGHDALRRDVEAMTTRAFRAVGRALGGPVRAERLESRPCSTHGVQLLRRGTATDPATPTATGTHARARSTTVARAWTAEGLHPGVQRDRRLDGDLDVAGDDVLPEARHGLEGGVRVRLVAAPPATAGTAGAWTLEARTACLPATAALARALD